MPKSNCNSWRHLYENFLHIAAAGGLSKEGVLVGGEPINYLIGRAPSRGWPGAWARYLSPEPRAKTEKKGSADQEELGDLLDMLVPSAGLKVTRDLVRARICRGKLD